MMELYFHSKEVNLEKEKKLEKEFDEKELEKSPDKRFIKYDKEVGRGSFKVEFESILINVAKYYLKYI